MKKVLIVFVLFFSCIIKGQEKDTMEYFNIVDLETNKIKKDTMEYFNMDKYKDWDVDNGHFFCEDRKFLKKGNDRIEINFYTDQIVCHISNTINDYKLYKSYFINKNLNTIGRGFSMFNIGVWEIYDENGKMIEEIYNDRPYLFSLEQLIVKVKKEYNVDLETKVSGMLVNRMVSEDLKKPVYEVNLPCEDNDMKRRYILIDGTTGDTLFETFYFMQSEEMSPFSRYLVALYNKKQEDNTYYKTYNCKDYTKKEWEAFEEEWYKDYKNKGFWDDIFPGRKKN